MLTHARAASKSLGGTRPIIAAQVNAGRYGDGVAGALIGG